METKPSDSKIAVAQAQQQYIPNNLQSQYRHWAG